MYKIATFKIYGLDEHPLYKPVKVQVDKNGHCDHGLEQAHLDISKRYSVDIDDIELSSLE